MVSYIAPPTPKHPSDSASFLPLSNDVGSNMITSITDANVRDIRAVRFSQVVILEFRFVAFSDLSWRFATEISEMEDTGDPLPYENDNFVLADYILPAPPSSVTYRVPRQVMFLNGIASEAPRHTCRNALRKVLGRDD